MKTFLLLMSVVLFSSCATMMDGTKTKIHVYEGKPKGVGVYYNNAFVGYTPCVVYASKNAAVNNQSSIELRKEGYVTRKVKLSRRGMPGFIVADILLAVFPLFIDLATGCLFKVEPEEIKSDLSKAE
jgi:hypothetical protein